MLRFFIIAIILINSVFANDNTHSNINQLKTAFKHGDLVIIKGKITAHTAKNEYILTDHTGAIRVYIESDQWYKNMIIRDKMLQEIELMGYLQQSSSNVTFAKPLFVKAIKIKLQSDTTHEIHYEDKN